MCGPSEMNAPSEMYFFLCDTIPECLLVFILVGLRITDLVGLSSFRTSFFADFEIHFLCLIRKYVFSRHFSYLQLFAIQLVSSMNLLEKMQKYKIIV